MASCLENCVHKSKLVNELDGTMTGETDENEKFRTGCCQKVQKDISYMRWEMIS